MGTSQRIRTEIGVNKTINVNELSGEQVEAIYKRIGQWFNSDNRLRMVKALESNKLKVVELVGNHYFFEGNLKLNKGVWTYGVGS
jgi:ribosomal protein S13